MLFFSQSIIFHSEQWEYYIDSIFMCKCPQTKETKIVFLLETEDKHENGKITSSVNKLNNNPTYILLLIYKNLYKHIKKKKEKHE